MTTDNLGCEGPPQHALKATYAGRYRNRLGRGAQLRRGLWRLVWALFGRPTPTFLFRWRRFLANAFGANLHQTARLYPSVSIWAPWNLAMGRHATLADGVVCYSVDRITIDNDVTVSQEAFLCTASHDLCDPLRSLTTKPIHLRACSWVFARAFIGPGVTIGEGAVALACAVVVRDVPPWMIVGGSPARLVKKRMLRENPDAL